VIILFIYISSHILINIYSLDPSFIISGNHVLDKSLIYAFSTRAKYINPNEYRQSLRNKTVISAYQPDSRSRLTQHYTKGFYLWWDHHNARNVFHIINLKKKNILFFCMAKQPLVSQCLLMIEDSWSHSNTPHSLRLFWASDQPNSETFTWQHTKQRQSTMPPAGFKLSVPKKKWPQTNALNRAATGIPPPFKIHFQKYEYYLLQCRAGLAQFCSAWLPAFVANLIRTALLLLCSK